MIASALDGVGFGTITGALEGSSLSERRENAVRGGEYGTLRAATPVALSALSKYVAPLAKNIWSRVNPAVF
ncbi:hypothetical protein V1291_005293 [Nitrobacteraceae bacterium AZCC 1564]